MGEKTVFDYNSVENPIYIWFSRKKKQEKNLYTVTDAE